MPQSEPPDDRADEIPYVQVWQTAVPSGPPPPPLPPVSPDYRGFGDPYARPARPGVITTIGVVSIVIAAFSMIGSGVSAVQVLAQAAFMQVAPAFARASQLAANRAAATQAAATQPAAAVSESGLAADERQTAVSLLTSRASLSTARQAQLDELLARGGQEILGVAAGGLTTQRVRAAIQSTGRGRPLQPDEPGPDYITTTSGTIELYNTHGVFRPTDRSQPTLRADADVNRYLGKADDGTTTTFSYSASATASSASPAMPVFPPFNRNAIAIVIVEAALSFALGIYLLVAGILTVRGSRGGGKLHWAYIVLKLPLIALGLYGWMRFQQAFAATLAAGQPGYILMSRRTSSLPGVFTSGPSVMAALAAIYPLTLIVLLCTRAVRDYYSKGA